MSDDTTEDEKLIDTFVIGDNTYENLLNDHLYIDQNNLSGEFAEHSERFAWYATAYELAQDVEGTLKVHLDRIYAVIDAKARADLKSAGVKYTEKMIENTVITSQEYQNLQNMYLKAKKYVGVLKAARDAMIHRRDMLVSLGANYRAEGFSDISLKTDAYKSGNFSK